jgi:hypothetical protein
MVFQLFGPYPGSNNARAIPLYDVSTDVPVMEINMNWDHTCNVVVLQPFYYPNGTLITTREVSEYDRQVRPQVNYEFDPKDCDDCWIKVSGTSGLDFGTWNSIWEPELNCGASCLQYTLEDHYIKSTLTPPRRLIGRSFRLGTLGLNITDSVNIQSLNWNPLLERYYAHKNQFIGIGICCTETWCHPDCDGLDSHLVLFSFIPEQTGKEIQILADIGGVVDQDTIRLGVEFASQYMLVNPQVFVVYQQSVVSFDVVVEDNIVVSAKRASQTPKIEKEMAFWAGLVSY